MKFLYPLAKRFIAGHDFDSAKPVIEGLMKDGYEVSIDYIGENNDSFTKCEKAYQQYIEILKYFRKSKINVSVKPSQLGLEVHEYLPYIFIGKIASRAAKYEQSVRLDMEGPETTEYTRNLAIHLNKKHGNVGVAIQANLERSQKDIDRLVEDKVSIRLVKGAYKGDITNATISARFSSLAYYLKSKESNRPAIATHDEELLNKINNKYYDYELLYGVRRDIQKSLKQEGHCVRIYIPFGKDWLPYTMRRLKEWKNLKFVVKNILKEWFKA